MKVYGVTDKGIVRQDNQDCFRTKTLPGGRVAAVVCDGMGGARAGNVASSMAAECFMSLLADFLNADMLDDHARALADAARYANIRVYDRSFTDFTCGGMGSTLVGAIAERGMCTVVNVGDSRAYHISRGDARQITHDHSLVQEYVDNGYITPEQAETHPRRNVITRAIGTAETIESDIFTVELSAGDLLLLCSDGLSNTVRGDEMARVWYEEREVADLCGSLLELALSRGAPDNVTVVALTA